MSFKSVQNKIAKEGGYSKKSAGAILANASRHASAAAKKKNPKLKKVKGGSTSIPVTSMKGKALSQDRQSNLSAKKSFCGGM